MKPKILIAKIFHLPNIVKVKMNEVHRPVQDSFNQNLL